MGMMPQFAGAKLHLICQITKLLDFFLLQNAHFYIEYPLFEHLSNRFGSISEPFFLLLIQIR